MKSFKKLKVLKFQFFYFKLFFIFFAFISISCKKENYELAVFKIITPFENAVFNENDTIRFKIQLLNNVDVKYAQLSIVDEKSNIVSSQFQYFPSFELSNYYSSDFPLKMLNSLSGQFFLKIQLFNKSLKESNEFVKINISAKPDSTLAIFVVTEASDNMLKIYKLSEQGDILSSFSINTDYSSSEVVSNSKSLIICGKYFGPLSSYSTETNNLQWTKPAINNPPFPYFNAMNYDGKFVSSSLYDGTIRAYNVNGTAMFAFNIANFRPYNFIRVFDNLLNIEYYIFLASHIQNINHRIYVNFSASYSNMQYHEFNWKPSKIFHLNNNNLIVFGNNNSQAIMKQYSIKYNIMNNIRNFPIDVLNDVIEISNGNFVITTPKYMMKYDFYTDLLTQFTLNQDYEKLAFDKINKNLWATKDFKLKRLNLLNFSSDYEILFNEKILNIHILYTK